MKRINPLIIMLSWVVGCLAFSLIAMPILGKTTPGGEQAPLEFLGRFIYVIVYGLLILSIATIFLFRKWSKKYWIVQAIPISLCCYLIISTKRNNTDAVYSFTRVDTTIGVSSPQFRPTKA
jgi:FtsH-binding integral membrane protein